MSSPDARIESRRHNPIRKVDVGRTYLLLAYVWTTLLSVGISNKHLTRESPICTPPTLPPRLYHPRIRRHLLFPPNSHQHRLYFSSGLKNDCYARGIFLHQHSINYQWAFGRRKDLRRGISVAVRSVFKLETAIGNLWNFMWTFSMVSNVLTVAEL